MRIFRLLLKAILRWAPAEFRERHGEEYLEIVSKRLREADSRGRMSVWPFAARELAGAVTAVLGMRLAMERPVAGAGSATGGSSTGGRETMMRTMIEDGRQALRVVRRNSGFTWTAVVVMALGMGAVTAIFSAANAYFFRPLPFQDPQRLVLLYETNPDFGWTHAQAAPANALDWREQVQAFEDIALYRDLGVWDVVLPSPDGPLVVGGTSVSGNFFDVLGVRPLLGRTFTWEETFAGRDDVVMLSHGLWVRRFGADPDVVGSTVLMGSDAVEREIVGIMPEGFAFPADETQLWIPYGWEPEALSSTSYRRGHWVRPVARLARGAGLEEADAQLQAVVQALQARYPETNRVMGAGLAPLRDFLVRDVRTPLMVLLGAVFLLLLLACANAANLMLVRSNDRAREIALRSALGAGRLRVARQLLMESVLLSLLGGVLGLGLGWLGAIAMATRTRLGIEGATQIALDGRVVLVILSVAIISGVVFGTGPALRVTTGGLQETLREGGGGGRGTRSLRVAGLLVAAEVALALLLVVGAGLMIRSAYLLRSVDPGFRVDGTLAVELTIPSSRYPHRDQVLAFWDELEDRVEARPGIERAGMVGWLPLAGTGWTSQFQAEGWPPDRVGLEIVHRRADRGYFEALDVPLVRGRLFDASDGPETPNVVVINETLAREHFPGEDPVGQKIAYDRRPTEESIWYEIVGIVGDQHQVSPGVAPRAEVFESRSQDWGRSGWLVMKTSVEPRSVVSAVRASLAEMDSGIPLAAVRPLREVWVDSLRRERFILVLLSAFGAAALVLASVGIYAVTAQAMRRRTREIGVRIALGADRVDVLSLALRQGILVIGLGLLVGLMVSLVATRALASFLFGIEPTDPWVLASVMALLGGVGLVACYIPARRATAVDPVTSLRAE